jgi:hypothetical protein
MIEFNYMSIYLKQYLFYYSKCQVFTISMTFKLIFDNY